MYTFPIGVMLDSFKTTVDQALEKATTVGVSGIQIYSTYGELAPENLYGEKGREFLKKVKDKGLTISAICGDLGHGFWHPEKNRPLIEKTKRIFHLAKKLETNIVTTHIGVIPESPQNERYKIMQEACHDLSNFAENLGIYFAVETGPEDAKTLKSFLDSLGTKGAAVNLDPANLLMVKGENPVEAVYILKDYIVHTHAKDGIRYRPVDPEIVYGIKKWAEPTSTPTLHNANMVDEAGKFGAISHNIEKRTTEKESDSDVDFAERPLGEGSVNFPLYLKALDDIGYKGFLTIECKTGDNPEEDITKAVHFLKNIVL